MPLPRKTIGDFAFRLPHRQIVNVNWGGGAAIELSADWVSQYNLGFDPLSYIHLTEERSGGTVELDLTDEKVAEILITENDRVYQIEPFNNSDVFRKRIAVNIKRLNRTTKLTVDTSTNFIAAMPLWRLNMSDIHGDKAPLWGSMPSGGGDPVPYHFGDTCAGAGSESIVYTPHGCWTNDEFNLYYLSPDGILRTEGAPGGGFYYNGPGELIATVAVDMAPGINIERCFNDHVDYSHVMWSKWIDDPTLLEKEINGIKRQFHTMPSDTKADNYWNVDTYDYVSERNFGDMPFVPKHFDRLVTIIGTTDEITDLKHQVFDFSKVWELPEGITTGNTAWEDRPPCFRFRTSWTVGFDAAIRHWLAESMDLWLNTPATDDYSLGLDP